MSFRLFFGIAVTTLLAGCAAQITGRAQRAIDAAQNTADAVVAWCGSSDPAAQAAANACSLAAAAVQSASDAYQSAANAATAATEVRVRAEQAITDLQNRMTYLDQNPNELQIRDSTPTIPNTEWRTYNVEEDKINEGILEATAVRSKAHADSSAAKYDKLWNAALNAGFGPGGTIGDARARYNEALLVATKATAAAEAVRTDGIEGNLPSPALAALKAEWALDKAEREFESVYLRLVELPRLIAEAKTAAKAESDAIAGRGPAAAALQTALDGAKTATLAADAQAQSCNANAPAINVRIPGYSETFWDISS